jgi:hypothetical protein
MTDQILEPEVLYDDRDREVDRELATIARWMDSVFEIPGTGIRLGLDPILGLIPGVGDLLTTLVSLYIGIDLVLGSLPFIGDAFDVFWKSNERNVALLRRHVLATPAEQRRARSGDWLFMAGLVLALVALLAASLALAYGILYVVGRALYHAYQ